MVQVGKAPYLECSTKGDKRFSAFHAKIKQLGNKSVEELYQFAKLIGNDIPDWRAREGIVPYNADYTNMYYSMLWNMYLDENIELLPILQNATGLSDIFGQDGHMCQAIELWHIRNELSIRVLVTGDRHWTQDQYAVVQETLYKIQLRYRNVIVIHGAATGVDTLADISAKRLNLNIWPFPALWDAFKRADLNYKYAGTFRNYEMLWMGQPHRVLAFHDDIENSKGTKNMIKQAQVNGVLVYLIDSKGNMIEYNIN